MYFINRLTYRTTDWQYMATVGVMLLVVPISGFNAIAHVWSNQHDRQDIVPTLMSHALGCLNPIEH